MRRFFFPALLFIILWIAGMVRFASEIPDRPQADPRRVDAVVVLTGGPDRLTHGLDILKRGLADRLLVSGVGKATNLKQMLVPYPDEGRDLQAWRGKVILDPKPDSTVTNAIGTAEWAKAEHIRSIRLVTADYHLPRSMLLFTHALPGVDIIPDPAFPQDFKRSEWWYDANSLRLVFLEYHKYCLTWLRLRLFPSP